MDVIFGITYGSERERERKGKRGKGGREKDDRQESSATPEAEISVLEVLRVWG